MPWQPRLFCCTGGCVPATAMDISIAEELSKVHEEEEDDDDEPPPRLSSASATTVVRNVLKRCDNQFTPDKLLEMVVRVLQTRRHLKALNPPDVLGSHHARAELFS